VTRRYALMMAIVCVAIAACTPEEGTDVIPATPVGHVARNWLAANNDGKRLAMVEYRENNRGPVKLSREQYDAALRLAIELAHDLGHLTALRVIESNDSTLAFRLKGENGRIWDARFFPGGPQDAVKYQIQLAPSPPGADTTKQPTR
jgi:hypothetical protein